MEFEGIPFEVIRRRVKYSRVEFKHSGEGLRIIVPRSVNPMKVLEENRKSILKKYYKLKKQIETAEKIPIADRSDHEFNAVISLYIERYSRTIEGQNDRN